MAERFENFSQEAGAEGTSFHTESTRPNSHASNGVSSFSPSCQRTAHDEAKRQ